MQYTLTDIQPLFPPKIFQSGTELFKQGCVTKTNVIRNGELITAVIKPLQTHPLRVYIQVRIESQGFIVKGECACDDKHNCQHVVAVLLSSLNDSGLLPDEMKKVTSSSTAPMNSQAEISAVESTLRPSLSSNNRSSTQVRQQLVYILIAQKNSHTLRVKSAVSRVNEPSASTPHAKDERGQKSNEIRFFDPSYVTRTTPARFLKAEDFNILSKLDGLPRDQQTGFPQLSNTTPSQLLNELLNDLITTRRCFYLHDDEFLQGVSLRHALQPAESRKLNLKWQMDKRAVQRLQWQVNPEAEVLFLSHLWYVDILKNKCGTLMIENTNGIPFPDDLIKSIFQASPIYPDQNNVINQWQQAYPKFNISGLHKLTIEPLTGIKPIPCLKLCTIPDSKEPQNLTDVIYFSLDYTGMEIGRNASDYFYNGKQIYRITRNRQAENIFVEQLLSLGLIELEQANINEDFDTFYFSNNSDLVMNWVNFQLDKLPKLLEQGWRIDIDDHFRIPVIEANQWDYVIGENEKTDWFDLGINAEVAGEKVDIIPALLILMESYPEGLPDNQDCPQYFSLALDDGRFVRVSAERLRYIFNTLLEFFNTGKLNANGKISVHRFKLARFATLKKDSEDLLKLDANNKTLTLVDQLQNIDKISSTTPPIGLNATLRPYQQCGLNWLQFLRQHRLAGILADDMGLGKTLQALAHIQMEKEQGRLENPALVVVPTSLLFNWRQEASRFTPDLKVLTLHGSQRHELFKSMGEYDLILTTYPLLHRDEPQLVKSNYHLLILDEAQIVKNPDTKASLAVRNLVATHRICLTGTPIENHLGELWSLFNFLMPEMLGHYRLFQRNYRTPIENGNEEKAKQLSRLMQPFLMRRTKEIVAPELPRKTEITIKAVFEGPQRELYESIRLAMHDEIKEEIRQLGIARSHIVVMNALLKLRQICCDPHLLDYNKYIKTYNGDSAKLELLMNMLSELIEEGRRILLFSQFTSMLSLIESKLSLENMSYLKLTGKTIDRESVVSQFQNREAPLLLISLKAGGVGLNLTEADTVIHYDPWWNPAIEQQASARAHRIGQKNPVFVYKLICQDTVEEKIQHMQQSKQAVVDALYDSKGGSEAQWNQKDIDELFGKRCE